MQSIASAVAPARVCTVPAAYDPRAFTLHPSDIELFDRELRSFVPPDAVDAHAHGYDLGIFDPAIEAAHHGGSTWVGYDLYRQFVGRWMGDRCATRGLFFPLPCRNLNRSKANELTLQESAALPEQKCLLIIGPSDDPATLEAQVTASPGVAGFKVYHLFSGRSDSFNATPEQYIPEWAWEMADKHELCIMLHLVMHRSLAESANQQYIRERCRRYPGARLILAHAGRGFCGRHTVEGVGALRGLDNLYFDTSAACESGAMEAIIETFGPTRLLYGSDFPLSELRGRAVNLADGYYWLYPQHVEPGPSTPDRPTLVGIESLLALKQACQRMKLNDRDVEAIFSRNALRLLKMTGSAEQSSDSSQSLYQQAKAIIPGGTQLLSKRPEMYAPQRWPAYFSEARGCEVIDIDGRHYLDFATSGIGTCLLGYAHPHVTAAVVRRVQLGSMSTLNSPEEVRLARMLIEMHPWAEQVRFARAGGEAMAVAARIARAATRRDVVAFCGYHGWTDWYLAANLGATDALDNHLLKGLSPNGVPRSLRGSALPFAYNQIEQLREIVREHGSNLAAVVMEPTRSVPPAPGFLESVREICDTVGARLVFDEVTTGFRLHRGGVHLKYGITPDIAVFAKALGSGHPIGAIVGRADTMQAAQESFISSTYWTEATGPAAAIATLEVMNQVDVPGHVQRIGQRVRDVLARLGEKYELPITLTGHPALTYIAFDHPQGAALSTLLTSLMLDEGILFGSAFYPTLAHEDHHVDRLVGAADRAMADLSDSLKRGTLAERTEGRVKHSGFARLS